MNYLRNSEQMREWKGRKVYGSHLRPDGVCAWTLKLQASWQASDKRKQDEFHGCCLIKKLISFSVEKNPEKPWIIKELNSSPRNVLSFSGIHCWDFAVAVFTALVTYVWSDSVMSTVVTGVFMYCPWDWSHWRTGTWKLKFRNCIVSGLYGENIYSP